MAVQVNITLTALNDDVFPPKRFLHLTPEKRTIQVGRASKSLSKGLMGAIDNAWFDSPVMSRNHAEIELSMESNTVTLKDIGSMHGTFLNNRQLPPKEAQTFKDGDNVVFGAEVSRGPESFPAVGFRINYETSTWKSSTANTFAFPESSDIEDDQEFSDEEIYGVDEMEDDSSEESVSTGKSPVKASIASDPIDLTQDDSENVETNTKSTNKDTPAQQTVINLEHKGVVDLCNEEESIENKTTVIIDESDSEEEGSIVESDYSSDDVDFAHTSSEHDPSESGFYSENEDDMVPEVEIPSSPSHSVHQTDLPPRSMHFHWLSTQASGSNTRELDEPSEDILEEDDGQSELCLTDVGATGIRELFEESSEHEENAASQGFSDASVQEPDEPSKHVTFSNERPLFSALLAAANMPESVTTTSNSTSPLMAGAQLQGNSIHRRPSPSDAAMVKTSARQDNILEHPVNSVKVHFLPTENWRKVTSLQRLGERLGKQAYFEARESNRAKFEVGATCPPTSLPGLNQAQNETMEVTSLEDQTPTFVPMKKQLGATTIQNQSFSMDYDYSGRLYSLDMAPLLSSSPILERSISPELDMTSAAMYNESKALAAANQVNQTAPAQQVRRLSIHDIIESSSTVQKPQSLKRKADNISGVVEKEIQEWASSTPSAEISSQPGPNRMPGRTNSSKSNSNNQEQDMSTSTPRVNNELHPSAINPMAAANTTEQRPAKRMRKFMERAGYVALGGAAATAGLFSLLVATAPEFL